MIISDALWREMENDIYECGRWCNKIVDPDGLLEEKRNRRLLFAQGKSLAQSLIIKYNKIGIKFDFLYSKSTYNKVETIMHLLRMELARSEEEQEHCTISSLEEGNSPQRQESDALVSIMNEAESEEEVDTMTGFQENNMPPVAAGAGKPRVFIVHGHDDAAKLEVARMLEHAGFAPIILHEQASKGKSIIGKIETYTDVCFAVVLYTPCDLGRAKEDTQERPRARQNVVFEHGYLIAKLGRERVCALVKDGVETPGDISGVVYIPMDSYGGWKLKLETEMKAVGLNFKRDT